jgi:hypothetical protein
MEQGAGDEVQPSRDLRDASRLLLEQAKASVGTAQQRLDLARNILQASWLWRAVRERRRTLNQKIGTN